jgi:hypothetical protein
LAILETMLIGGLGVGLYALIHRVAARRAALLRRLSHRLGGSLVPTESGVALAPRQVEADIQGALVRVSLEVSPERRTNHHTNLTYVRARYLLGHGPVFEVEAETPLLSARKTVGLEDIELGGNRIFDEIFVVQGRNPEALRLAFTDRAKALALELGRPEVRSDGRLVELALSDADSTPDRIETAARLVAELAHHGMWLLESLAEQIDARLSTPRGGWGARTMPTLRAQGAVGTVHLAPARHRGWPTFMLRARGTAVHDGTVLRVRAGAVARDDLALTRRQRQLAETLVDADLSMTRGHTELHLHTPGPGLHTRVQAGLKLLDDIAAPSTDQGPFR